MNSEKQYTNLQMTLRGVNRVGEEQKNVPKLRFKGYEDAWEQRRLGEFGISTGGTSIESEFVDDGDYKVISIGSYSETSQYTDQGLRVNKTSTTSSRILNKNDLAMILNDKTSSGKIIGRVLVINEDDSYVYNQRTQRIEVNKDYFSPIFLYQFLNADNIRAKIIRAAQGNTQIYVNWTTISEIEYTIPLNKREQEKIANYCNSLDILITLHQRKYDALKSMKKTLLSKIFPKNGEDVPEIRFKGYTDVWEHRKLGDIVLSEIKGSAKAEMIGGDTPYLETNYLNGGECLFVDSENNVDTDDVIILWDGSQAGTIYHGFTGALGSTFKAYKTACLGLFIFQQLKKNQQTIYDKYRTPNIPHVIKTFKDEYNIMLTSEREQNEIGRYFQQIDNLITLHQRKLEELKKMKKTLLQQMFV